MLVYRLVKESESGKSSIECFGDEGDEKGALHHLTDLLEKTDARNVAIVVTRRFGGIQIGSMRFRLIKKVAKQVIDKLKTM